MKYPERIICLTEETTELLYLLGEEKRIVGISAYTVRPNFAKKEKPVVSAFINGNIQKIISLNPDLIIGFSDIQSNLASELIKAGLNVLVTNQRSIQEIFDTMHLIGRIIGKDLEATKLIDSWKMKLENISENSKFNPKPKIFFQEWDEPIISSIRWVSELIEISGGKEIFDLKNSSLAKDRIVDSKDILDKNPEIWIGSWCGKPMNFDWIRNHSDLKNTLAVKKNRIYEIDSSIILQPGPALFLEGIDKLKEIIQEP
ncbi:MAG: cobalamin-binding protein [Leptospiraceae bacterium]|nr:cobalamin-binding protein [Leptospiraceae bacterium]